MTVKPVPDGFHTVTPYLVVRDVAGLMDFLRDAFGARIKEAVPGPDGKVAHGEVVIGDSVVMLGEAREEHPPRPSTLYLYIPDCDDAYRRAMEAGATSIMKPTDMFYGDRNGGVMDPAGNQWWVATHVEDVPPDEIARRAAERGK